MQRFAAWLLTTCTAFSPQANTAQSDRGLQRPDMLGWLSAAGCYRSLGICHSKMGKTILGSGPSGPLPGARVFRQPAARCRLQIVLCSPMSLRGARANRYSPSFREPGHSPPYSPSADPSLWSRARCCPLVDLGCRLASVTGLGTSRSGNSLTIVKGSQRRFGAESSQDVISVSGSCRLFQATAQIDPSLEDHRALLPGARPCSVSPSHLVMLQRRPPVPRDHDSDLRKGLMSCTDQWSRPLHSAHPESRYRGTSAAIQNTR